MKTKKIKIKVTEESQREMNKLRKSVGLEEKPIKPDYELNALFG